QKQAWVKYTDNSYTNSVLNDDAYRAPALCETRTYELVKAVPSSGEAEITNLFRFGEMLRTIRAAGDDGHDLPFEDHQARGATADHPYRRLIAHTRTLF